MMQTAAKAGRRLLPAISRPNYSTDGSLPSQIIAPIFYSLITAMVSVLNFLLATETTVSKMLLLQKDVVVVFIATRIFSTSGIH